MIMEATKKQNNDNKIIGSSVIIKEEGINNNNRKNHDNNDNNNNKHPLEETKSWELHLNRTVGRTFTNNNPQFQNDDDHRHQQRQLKKHHHNDNDNETIAEHFHHNKKKHHDDKKKEKKEKKKEEKKKKKKKKAPEPGTNTFHAMMIDAGSQGTRIHIYEFKERLLYNKNEIQMALNGLKISTPTTNSRWTNRLHPGLDSCASNSGNDTELMLTLETYLEPLLDFAKTILDEKIDEWEYFPIYLKATGGLRTLPTIDRVRLMNHVRILFNNRKFNPFAFQDEYARVISGEEEAIYGWTAVNYIKGTLVKESEGIGTVLNPSLPYGMIEMGGASTQIGFFENNGDVMANLFKLQIGGARHWNVYVHSFLYFGVNGAWSRLNADLYSSSTNSNITNSTTAIVKNPCLPVSSQVTFESWIHINNHSQLLPRSSPLSIPYSATLYNDQSDFESCSLMTRKLLRKEANAEWVTFSHDGDASFAGIYQPPLPISNNPISGSSIGGFIATSNFADIWSFLNLTETSAVGDVGERAKIVCNYNQSQLAEYNSKLDHPIDGDVLDHFCFRSVFVYEMLHSGYGFPLDYEITAVDTLHNQKLGWALGSILYEINTLPWEFSGKVNIKGGQEEEEMLGQQNRFQHSSSNHIGSHVVLAVCAVLVGLAIHIRYRARNSRRAYQSIPTNN